MHMCIHMHEHIHVHDPVAEDLMQLLWEAITVTFNSYLLEVPLIYLELYPIGDLENFRKVIVRRMLKNNSCEGDCTWIKGSWFWHLREILSDVYRSAYCNRDAPSIFDMAPVSLPKAIKCITLQSVQVQRQV